MKLPTDPASAVPAVLAELSREVALLAKALQSIHDMGCHTQAVLCALVDTHPAPCKAAAVYESYLQQLQAAGSLQQGDGFELLSSAWRTRFANASAALEKDGLIQSLRTGHK